LDSIRLLRRRLSKNTRRRGLNRRTAGLDPLSLSKARMRTLSRWESRPNINMCRRRRHPSFAVDVPVPSRDRDLGILGLRGEGTGLLRGHLRRQPLLADRNTRPGLRLNLWRALGGNRTALLWVWRLRGHTRTQPCPLLLLGLRLRLLRHVLRAWGKRLRSPKRLARTRPASAPLRCRLSIGLSIPALERAHERWLGALFLFGFRPGCCRGGGFAAKQQLGEGALLLLLRRLGIHRGAVRPGATRAELLAKLRGYTAGLRCHPLCLARWISWTRSTSRHLPSLLASGRPENRLTELLGRRLLGRAGALR
jgi:hypothetical protein